jgi:cytoskeletal protein CcmA (bactofilin family)
MFGESSPPQASAPDALPRVRRLGEAVEDAATRIGPGTRIRGLLSGDDSVDLGGSLDGPVRVEGHLHVREGARITGDVSAHSVVVEGELAARTLVAERVEIGVAARVRANVRARSVAIAEGAYFDGQVQMQGRDGPAAPHAFQEKRRGRRRHAPPDPTT